MTISIAIFLTLTLRDRRRERSSLYCYQRSLTLSGGIRGRTRTVTLRRLPASGRLCTIRR